MGFRCPAQMPGAQSEPPWGQLLPRSFLQKLTHNTMERKIRGGPPSTSSSTTMVAAAEALSSTPGGPPSNIFVNYDGGRCRSSRQHPRGQQSVCALKLGTYRQYFCCATPTRGPQWPTLLRQIGQSFAGKYSLKRAEDPGNINAERFVHQTQDKVIYLQNVWQGRKA
jgi:hypothetical protein